MEAEVKTVVISTEIDSTVHRVEYIPLAISTSSGFSQNVFEEVVISDYDKTRRLP